jgi:hypothetical protein
LERKITKKKKIEREREKKKCERIIVRKTIMKRKKGVRKIERRKIK